MRGCILPIQQDGGVVVEHIDAAETGDGGIHERCDPGLIGDIGRDCNPASAMGVYFFHQRFESLGVGIGRYNARSFMGKASSYGISQPTAQPVITATFSESLIPSNPLLDVESMESAQGHADTHEEPIEGRLTGL